MVDTTPEAAVEAAVEEARVAAGGGRGRGLGRGGGAGGGGAGDGGVVVVHCVDVVSYIVGNRRSFFLLATRRPRPLHA